MIPAGERQQIQKKLVTRGGKKPIQDKKRTKDIKISDSLGGNTQSFMFGIIILHCGGRMWILILRYGQGFSFTSILVQWRAVANCPPPPCVPLSLQRRALSARSSAQYRRKWRGSLASTWTATAPWLFLLLQPETLPSPSRSSR